MAEHGSEQHLEHTEAHKEHIGIPGYFGVFAILVVGTILTYWVATIDLDGIFPGANTLVALLDRIYQDDFRRFVFYARPLAVAADLADGLSGFFWLAIMFAFTMQDYVNAPIGSIFQLEGNIYTIKTRCERQTPFVAASLSIRTNAFYRAIIFDLMLKYSYLHRFFVRVFQRQQTLKIRHQNQMMSERSIHSKLIFPLFILFILFLNGCGVFNPKDSVERAKLLKVEDAAQADLLETVNRFAKVNSMRAKMDLKFEDNSYAEIGLAEKYKTADGEIVVQRPSNILLKVQIPIVKTDIVQMTSDGEKFRVAILEDGGSGKYKGFILGTNDADYSSLQKEVEKIGNGDVKTLKENVNAFSNLRPQHFTDAMLVRPVDTRKLFLSAKHDLSGRIRSEREEKIAHQMGFARLLSVGRNSQK